MAPDASFSEPPPLSGDGLGTPRFSADPPSVENTSEVERHFAELDFSTSRGDAPALVPNEKPPLVDNLTEPRTRGTSPAFSWTNVILGSYASAVTLALIWVLATGKTLPRYRVPAPDREFDSRPITPSHVSSSIPTDRAVRLGESILVGDLEIMPLMVLHKTVRASDGAGLEERGREIPNCLTLTLRLKNLSRDRELTPFEPPSVRNGASGEASYIEMGTGRQISVLDPTWENNGAIDSQSFSTIAPGAVADVVLVSESVASERLVGPLTWWVALKTGEDGMETIGVRFSRREVSEVGE